MVIMEVKLAQILSEQRKSTTQITAAIKTNTDTLTEYKITIDKVALNVNTINTRLGDLTKKVNKLENDTQKRFVLLEKRVTDIENSRQFDSQTIDAIKHKQESNSVQELVLKEQVDNLANQLKDEKIGRNADAQYQRSCFHVKIVGVPMQVGEEGYTLDSDNNKIRSTSANNLTSLEIISDIVSKANIEGFHPNQIDVCHRTSSYHFSPIIVKFLRKNDKENFYRQRNKLRNLDITDLQLTWDPTKLGEWRDTMAKKQATKDWTDKTPQLMFHEHLTELNNKLLLAARTAAFKNGYKFTGYLHGGAIHVKKVEGAKALAIHSMDDVSKIT